MAISAAKALNPKFGIPAALFGSGLFALLLACYFILCPWFVGTIVAGRSLEPAIARCRGWGPPSRELSALCLRQRFQSHRAPTIDTVLSYRSGLATLSTGIQAHEPEAPSVNRCADHDCHIGNARRLSELRWASRPQRCIQSN